MPRPRFQKAPLEKRDALLDVAAKEFATHGYDNASINRILLAAGFSKGSFYYYFDDKLDLAAAVLERESTRYVTLWSELRTTRTPAEFWSEIERLAALGIKQLRQAPHTTTDALLRLGTAMTHHPELLERACASAVGDAKTKLHAFWEHGIEIGAVRNDLPMSTLVALIQETKMLLVRLLLPNDRTPTEEEFDAFSRFHLDLVRRVTELRHATS